MIQTNKNASKFLKSFETESSFLFFFFLENCKTKSDWALPSSPLSELLVIVKYCVTFGCTKGCSEAPVQTESTVTCSTLPVKGTFQGFEQTLVHLLFFALFIHGLRFITY